MAKGSVTTYEDADAILSPGSLHCADFRGLQDLLRTVIHLYIDLDLLGAFLPAFNNLDGPRVVVALAQKVEQVR